jgi:hypothetical protein
VPLPKAPAGAAPDTIAADALARRIDQFLASRGIAGGAAPGAPARPPAARPPAPADFVCEDDVRAAAREGRTILVSARTIITPAAQDAGTAARVFVWQGMRP